MAYKSLSEFKKEQQKKSGRLGRIRNGLIAAALIGGGGYFGGPYAYDAAKDYASDYLVSQGITNLPFFGDLQSTATPAAAPEVLNQPAVQDDGAATPAEQPVIVAPAVERPASIEVERYDVQTLLAWASSEEGKAPNAGLSFDNPADNYKLAAVLSLQTLPEGFDRTDAILAALEVGNTEAVALLLSKPVLSNGTVVMTIDTNDLPIHENSLIEVIHAAQSSPNSGESYALLVPMVKNALALKGLQDIATDQALKDAIAPYLPTQPAAVVPPVPVQEQTARSADAETVQDNTAPTQKTGGWNWLTGKLPNPF